MTTFTIASNVYVHFSNGHVDGECERLSDEEEASRWRRACGLLSRVDIARTCNTPRYRSRERVSGYGRRPIAGNSRNHAPRTDSDVVCDVKRHREWQEARLEAAKGIAVRLGRLELLPFLREE